jgi:hypothetical protein
MTSKEIKPSTVGHNFSKMLLISVKFQILYRGTYVCIYNVTSFENDIITNLQEIGWEGLHWAFLAEDNINEMGYLGAKKCKNY